MNWKPIYAALIFSSTFITYFCALLVQKLDGDSQPKRKMLLIISIVLNLGVLFIFKYFNFINESVFSALSWLGIRWDVPDLDVLLPVGISFYTFQAVGYSIDVYRRQIRAEQNFITYALFVSFFPQLVAGPIERAKNLLPQFYNLHSIKYINISGGGKMMLWGFFMKLCVADTVGEYVDAIYNNVSQHSGISFILATILFAFQIYCDFGGYSLIARGCAKVMGFDLMVNFRQPYLSSNIKDFWRRWHISLSTWFSDYVYIPLGGNRVCFARHLMNLLITFLVSGIWHGANWTFFLWGLTHGIYIVTYNILKRFKIINTESKSLCIRWLQTIICFLMVSFAWIFFRANTVSDAFCIIRKIFTDCGKLYVSINPLIHGAIAILILIITDIKANYNIGVSFLNNKNKVVRYLAVITLISYILLFGTLKGGQFIYFQF